MIKHNYDSETESLYVTLDPYHDRVGTLEVQGDIKFRKPTEIVPFDGLILLDFTKEGALVGVEVVSSKCIPNNIKKPQPIRAAKVELTPRCGSSISDMSMEANSIHNSFMSSGVKVEVSFKFNDELYISRGTHCERIQRIEEE